MITLKNKKRQPAVFNLDAPFFVRNNNETPFGKPCTLTLLALEAKECDEAVLSCTEVKVAIDRGDVKVLPKTATPAAKPEEKSEKPAKRGSK